MKSFRTYINESKNLHMEHLEDSVFNEGSSGVVDAIRFLESVTDMLSGSSKGKVNIYTLAKNAGTSVNQLERFYLKNLALDDEIVKNLQSF